MKVLDSTFIIDLLRNKKEAVDIVQSKEVFMTTQINMYEVIRGALIGNQKKLAQITEFFENIRVLSLDEKSVMKSSEIYSDLFRRGVMISDCDCLTAGIALSNNVTTILTRNIKHFKRIKGIIAQGY